MAAGPVGVHPDCHQCYFKGRSKQLSEDIPMTSLATPCGLNALADHGLTLTK